MKKYEIITALEPFTDDLDISVTNSKGTQIEIKHFDYHLKDNGEGEVTIVPIGSHLSKEEDWVKITQ